MMTLTSNRSCTSIFMFCSNYELCWSTINRPKPQLICIVLILLALAFLTFHSHGFWNRNDDVVEVTSHKSARPMTNSESSDTYEYAILIDAGSSGSRVFIYTWPPHNGDANELLQIRPLRQDDGEPVVKKIEPGLSSVASQPWKASDYIHPLLDFAVSHIPSSKHKTTPLYILATAGLRLLDADIQTAILEDLRSDIVKNFSFHFTPNNAEVISGKQEGLFQWIAINYVLGRFNHNSNGRLAAVDVTDAQSLKPVVFRKKTVGIMDMGGASMQLAVELTTKMQVDSLQRRNKNIVTEINLGCEDHNFDHRYNVYVSTYLGMGANEARGKYEDMLIRKHFMNAAIKTENITISDPCLPAGLVVNVSIPLHFSANVTLINNTYIILNGNGRFDSCHNHLQQLLQEVFGCPGESCILDELPMNLELNDFFGFSEFWYSMEDVLRIGGPYDFYKFRKAAKNFCGTEWSVLENRFEKKEYPLAMKSRLMYQCFKSAWIAVTLHNGLGLDHQYHGLRSSPNTVKGEVVHWSLGAIILKTRFLPLREIQKGNAQLHNKASANTSIFHLNSIALVVCFAVVMAAIVLYLQRLKCLKKIMWSQSSKQYSSLKLDDVENGYLNSSRR